jgi:hypothetical protein
MYKAITRHPVVILTIFTLMLLSYAVIPSRTSAHLLKQGTLCAPPSLGMISWWPGDGNANDLVDTNHGTLNGGTATAFGKVSQAFSFNGTGDFVDIPDSPSLDSISSTITVEAWINPEIPNTNRGYIFARRDPYVTESFSLHIDPEARIGVVIRTTSSPDEHGSFFVTAPGVVQFGQWQHIAVTVNTDTGLLKAYINGQLTPMAALEGPSSFSGPMVNADHIFIGQRQSLTDPGGTEGATGAAYYKGLIDELTVYSVELTQSQIADIYLADSAGKCKEPKPTPTPTPGPNQSPVAGFTMKAGTQAAIEGQTLNLIAPTGPVFINFSANRSSDPDGGITKWEWRIDGTIVSRARNFTYGLNIGNHTVTLVVTDNRGARSQAVTGRVVITSLPPPTRLLKLFPSHDEGSNHPLDIRAENISRPNDNVIVADIVITNRTGTWFQVNLNFNAPSSGASSPLSDNRIPFNRLIGPFGEIRFRTEFREGQYLQYDATRRSPAVVGIMGLDIMARLLLGVELSSRADLAVAVIEEILPELLKSGCAGQAFNNGLGLFTCNGPLLVKSVCVGRNVVDLVQCMVGNPKLRKALEKVFGKFFGKKTTEELIGNAATILRRALFLIDQFPKFIQLMDHTNNAAFGGYVRLEARR